MHTSTHVFMAHTRNRKVNQYLIQKPHCTTHDNVNLVDVRRCYNVINLHNVLLHNSINLG